MKPKNKFLILILIALIINIIWEFSHYQLYIDLSGIPSTRHLIQASFFDMLLLIGIFLFISLKNKTISWINKPKKSDYIIIIITGFIIAIFIETINLNFGRWAYKEIMPTIFGIGLSPFLQLALTGILSLFIVNILLSVSNNSFNIKLFIDAIS